MVLAGNWASSRTDDQATPPPTPPSRVDAGSMMKLICLGRPDSVLTLLEADEGQQSGDPMAQLLIARALRDRLSDEDDDKDRIKRDADPILEHLDRAITLCDKEIEHPSTNPVYYYYRGRAWLGKAQVYTLTRSYWGAGRAASHAKHDLEKFLESEPNHPDAQGDLGAFLYFADTLPGVVKFLSKLLFIPGGDRERGLRMLTFAATHNGAFTTDYQIALAAIYLVFEGRFEEGTVAMEELIDRYPYYARLVEPYGVLAPLYPTRIREFQRLEDRVIAHHLSRGSNLVDWSLVKRIQLHRSYVNMFFGHPQRAFFELGSLVEKPVERPDWMLPLAMINLGHLEAKRGETETALGLFNQVKSTDSMSHFHDLAGGLIKSLESPWKPVELADLDFVASIYDGNLPAARDGLAAYEAKYGRDVLYNFYLAETELFAQNFVASARAYNACLEAKVSGGDQSYQMFAAMRLGEIHGHEHRYDTAGEYFDKAKEYTHAGYLLDFMVNSRKRYYELLDNGTIEQQPTLLLQQSMSESTAPLTTNQ